jgi:hypothetical protein
MRPSQFLVCCSFAVFLTLSLGQPVSAADPPSASEPPGTMSEQPSGGPDEPGARGPGGEGGLAPNCRAEIKQLCQGVEPGGGRMRKCFKENEGKLSPACRQQIEEHRGRAKERTHALKAACEGDVKRFCPNLEPGGGRIGGCLKEHSNELSEGCARAMEQRHRKGESKHDEPARPQ